MKGKRFRTASIVVVAVAALTFPVWGPMNGASSAPKADPTCVPTPTPTCVPDLPSGVPTDGLPTTPPSGVPTDGLPSGAPSVPAPGVPSVPAPGLPSGSPTAAAPVSGCVGYLRGFTSSCGFTLVGDRIVAAGFALGAGLVPTVNPSAVPVPSGVPSVPPSGLPSGAPSGLPTAVPSVSGVPTAVPTPTGIPAPAGAHRSARSSVRIVIEVVNKAGQVLLRCTGDGEGFAVCTQQTTVKVTGEVLECRARRPAVGLFGCASI